jgi:hypothetical protein
LGGQSEPVRNISIKNTVRAVQKGFLDKSNELLDNLSPLRDKSARKFTDIEQKFDILHKNLHQGVVHQNQKFKQPNI